MWLIRLYRSLQDENDNTPRFENTSYLITVRENDLASGGGSWYPRVLLQVRATDPDDGENGNGNGLLSYQLQAPPGQEETVARNFALYQDGSLHLLQTLDYEDRTSYSFQVLAIDQGKPEARTATAAVHVRVLDDNDEPVCTSACLCLCPVPLLFRPQPVVPSTLSCHLSSPLVSAPIGSRLPLLLLPRH